MPAKSFLVWVSHLFYTRDWPQNENGFDVFDIFFEFDMDDDD